MKKWVCTVCGYVYEGDAAPEKSATVCKAYLLPSSKSRKLTKWYGLQSTM